MKAEFDVLTETLHSRTLERVGGEKIVQRRGAHPAVSDRVQRAPASARALHRGARFARASTRKPRSSGVSTSPAARRPVAPSIGCWRAASGGTAGCRATAACATNFEQPSGGGASFFVTDLLRKIIFPDRQLGTTSKVRVARHVRKQVLIGAGLLVLTTLIVIPAATSYLDNVDLDRRHGARRAGDAASAGRAARR